MVGFFSTLDEHIINMDLYTLTDLILEDPVEQLLIGGPYIF